MWTEDQARALIPDAGTLKRGLELATPTRWTNLGQTAEAVWGHCQGSGSRPYLVGIDVALGPAFKCSCPSRVFPCKHGAGLLLLLARQPQGFSATTPPDWLQEWLEKRQQTQEKKDAKAEAQAAAPAPADEPSAPDTPELLPGLDVAPARLARMQRGAAELLTWLHDLLGSGLAQTDSQPASFWENQAARLVDDQLPGLAAMLRELPQLRYGATDWPERLLARLGEIGLLARAFGRLPELPAELRQDVLQLVGVNVKKELLLAQQPAVADEWLVVAQVATEEERLQVRRSWLWGYGTGRYALVLEYAFGAPRFELPLLPGALYRGSLTFYPGAVPLRAVPSPTDWHFRGTQSRPLPPGHTPAELLDAYAAALGRLPWLREWPATLTEVVPLPLPDGRLQLLHPPSGEALPLRTPDELAWELLAVSGGHPLTVFGEWNGRALLPLAFLPTSLSAPL